MNSKNRKLIAIIGPTASGKTGIGVRLARELNGEIISADSRQVYCGLDIGSGKEHFTDVRQWLIDIVEPEKRFTLFNWLPLARLATEDIFSRGKVPIVVGGTGLYVQALTEGFWLEQMPNKNNVISSHRPRGEKSSILCSMTDKAGDFSPSLRRMGRNDDYGQIEKLRWKLEKLDSLAYSKIDLNNPHRLVRAIERAEQGLKPAKKKPDFEVLQIGIDLPRDELYKRIDDRVEQRFSDGMLEEIIGLIISGVDTDWLQKLGLEYRIITKFIIQHSPAIIQKRITNVRMNEETNNSFLRSFVDSSSFSVNKAANHLKSSPEYQAMKQELKYKIHTFARRQLTWFRRFPEIVWLKDEEKILECAKNFLFRTFAL